MLFLSLHVWAGLLMAPLHAVLWSPFVMPTYREICTACLRKDFIMNTCTSRYVRAAGEFLTVIGRLQTYRYTHTQKDTEIEFVKWRSVPCMCCRVPSARFLNSYHSRFPPRHHRREQVGTKSSPAPVPYYVVPFIILLSRGHDCALQFFFLFLFCICVVLATIMLLITHTTHGTPP